MDDEAPKKRGGYRPGSGRKKKVFDEHGRVVLAPPPVPAQPPVTPSNVLTEFEAAGEPPSDPLEAVSWFARVLTIVAKQVMRDGSLTEKARRAELRQIAKSVSTMVPLERLLEAERKVRRAADEMERPNADSELQSVAENLSGTLRMPS